MTISYIPMRGFGQFQYEPNGERVIFSLICGEKTDPKPQTLNFMLDFDMLMPFIGALQQIGEDAEGARARNPMHQGQLRSGFAFGYESADIGPATLPGGHVLALHEKGPQGKSHHSVAFDRAGLERLSALLASYLSDLDSGMRGPDVH